jgi:hypothetical protein
MPTPNWALPQPTGTDLASTADDSITAISNTLDNAAHSVTVLRKGVFASRPSAASAKSGCYYLATDTGVLYLSDGTSWIDVSPRDSAAGTASLRTLGTGATQAAAGNHVHTGYGIVAGSSANVRTLYGKINSDGTRHSGSPGWTSVRSGVGVYRITYGISFSGSSVEAVLLTPWAGANPVMASHNTPQGSYVDVYTWRWNGVGVVADDNNCSFTVIGAV